MNTETHMECWVELSNGSRHAIKRDASVVQDAIDHADSSDAWLRLPLVGGPQLLRVRCCDVTAVWDIGGPNVH